MKTIKWLCIIIGALGCALAAVLQYQKQNEASTVKPVVKTAPASATLETVSSGVETTNHSAIVLYNTKLASP